MEKAAKKWATLVGMVGVLVLGPAGCGDSDNNGGGTPVNSGLPGDKPLNTLSDAESKQLCTAVETAAKDPAIDDNLCKFAAYIGVALAASFSPMSTDAELQMTCSMSYTECKKPSTDPPEPCMKPSANCTATVAEVEKCLNDMKTALISLGASVPACSSVTRASLMSQQGGSGQDPFAEPASCKTVDMKCPGLIEDPEGV